MIHASEAVQNGAAFLDSIYEEHFPDASWQQDIKNSDRTLETINFRQCPLALTIGHQLGKLDFDVAFSWLVDNDYEVPVYKYGFDTPYDESGATYAELDAAWMEYINGH